MRVNVVNLGQVWGQPVFQIGVSPISGPAGAGDLKVIMKVKLMKGYPVAPCVVAPKLCCFFFAVTVDVAFAGPP